MIKEIISKNPAELNYMSESKRTSDTRVKHLRDIFNSKLHSASEIKDKAAKDRIAIFQQRRNKCSGAKMNKLEVVQGPQDKLGDERIQSSMKRENLL